MTTTGLACCAQHQDQELVLLTNDVDEPIERDGLYMAYAECCGVVGVRDARVLAVARRVEMESQRFWVEKVRQ